MSGGPEAYHSRIINPEAYHSRIGDEERLLRFA